MTRRIALLLLSLLLPFAAGAATPAPVQGALVEGTHYETLREPGTFGPALAKGQHEVAEIFAYTCTHCAALAPRLDAWKAKMPKAVRVQYVPAGYQLDDPLARAFFASESMGKLAYTHLPTFRAIHDEHMLPRNPTDDEMATFYATLGVDQTKFKAAMTGFKVAERMQAARAFSLRTELHGTPTIIVDGRWKVLGGSLDALLNNTAALLASPPR